jgi:steroid 5-alpha reductase family enzyme
VLIRKVFGLFALAMLALLVSRVYADVWSSLNWAMLAISMTVTLLVFSCFVYVFNYSYAAASVFNSLLIAVLYPTAAGLLLAGLMALYGIRLGAFSWSRVNSESYATRVANTRAADEEMPVFVKGALWIQCCLLYTFHLLAVYLAAQVGTLSAPVLAGGFIIAAGIVIEAVADVQKQQAKNVAPDNYVVSGLFACWRHPNYVGEIIVQLGLLVVGVGVVTTGWANYLAVSISPAYIILLMISECVRADASLKSRHQDDPAFVEYWRRSGSFFPSWGN